MEDIGIEREAWERLSRTYHSRWRARLYAVDAAGALVYGGPSCRNRDCAACMEARAMALRETLRWGEPTVQLCPARRLMWAIPLMRNEVIVGGLAASVAEKDFFRRGAPSFDLRRACTDLREMAEGENLTNASALAFSRFRYQDEQRRAYAIHAFKGHRHDSIRELYLREEPALFSAIRAGDRPAARAILNSILVAIHHHAGERMELVKSLFLELVVSMTRTAVEAGGAPEELLSANAEGVATLSKVSSVEELAAWLSGTLEHLMDLIGSRKGRDPGQAIFDALDFMERHCGAKISRSDAARAAHLSPSHFSHLMRKESGASFTELLARIRVDRAAEMLARGDKPIALIALECGFEDQSYFTKVFQRYRGQTPGAFRRARKTA